MSEMAVASADWMPILAIVIGLYIVDKFFFGGKYLSLVLDRSGNSNSKWAAGLELYFHGRHIHTIHKLGYLERAARDGRTTYAFQLGFETDTGEMIYADSDDLEIPPEILKHFRVERVDLMLRSDRRKEYQEEIDALKFRLAHANAKANQAWWNTMDFTTSMTAKMGDWRKNMGTQTIIGTKTGSGVQYSEQAPPEGGTE